MKISASSFRLFFCLLCIISITIPTRAALPTAAGEIFPPSGIGLTAVYDETVCPGSQDNTIDLIIDNPDDETLSILWSNGSTAEDQSNLSAGAYSVTVTGQTCEVTAAFLLTESSPLILSAVSEDIDCIADMPGTIDLSVSGGTTPYTFAWSNGAVTEDLFNLDNDNNYTYVDYTVTVSDAAGCTAILTDSIIRTNHFWVWGNYSVDMITCHDAADGAVHIEGSENLEVLWTENGSGETGTNLTGLDAGDYFLSVSNSVCQGTLIFPLFNPPPFSVEVLQPDTICYGTNDGEITVEITDDLPEGECPYGVWLNTDTNPVPWTPGTCRNFENLEAGIYNLTGSNSTGCYFYDTIEIVAYPELNINAEIQNATCFFNDDGSIDLTTTGGVPFTDSTYVYSIFPEVTPVANGVYTGLSAGSYDVTVTDSTGCSSVLTVIIQEQSDMTTTFAVTDVSCTAPEAGIIRVTASGGTPDADCGYTYATVPALPQDSCGRFVNAAAGLYLVSTTDSNGCTVMDSVVVAEVEAIAVATEVTAVTCTGAADGSIVFTAAGGTPFSGCPYLYTVVPAIDAQDCGMYTGLSGGEYTFTLTDSMGCQSLRTVTLPEPDPLTASVNVIDVECYGADNGRAVFTTEGGTLPYNNAANDNNLAPGIYTTVITDAAGCSVTLDYEVSEPDSFTFDLVIQDASATDSNDGGIYLENITGGTLPYNFYWSVVGAEESLENVSAGEHPLSIIDGQGCLYQYEFTVGVVSATENIRKNAGISLRPTIAERGRSLTLTTENKAGEQLTVQTVATDGRVLTEQSVEIPSNFYETEISTDNLPAGVYFLRVGGSSGESGGVRFLVW